MVDPKKTAVKEDEEPVTAEALERRGKRWAANFLKREPSPRLLHQLLDKLLSPLKPISDENLVEWMRWIMAADKTPEEFAEQGEFSESFKVFTCTEFYVWCFFVVISGVAV